MDGNASHFIDQFEDWLTAYLIVKLTNQTITDV